MNENDIAESIRSLFAAIEGNTVHLPEEDTDVTIVEEPLIGIASADDPLFAQMKRPEVIGESWMAPNEWLESARSVIVFFFPYSEQIRRRARESQSLSNEAWRQGYPAGRAYAKVITDEIKRRLEEEGYSVCDPLNDPRMKTVNIPVMSGEQEDLHYISAWSTRHAGFVAGLGTFGIHRHIITEKGCCGSLMTLITDAPIEPTKRSYSDVYENCIHCGKCITRCPVEAITLENMRNLKICSEHGASLRPRFGSGNCGRCMVGVPCEHGKPVRQ